MQDPVCENKYMLPLNQLLNKLDAMNYENPSLKVWDHHIIDHLQWSLRIGFNTKRLSLYTGNL